MTQVCVGIKSIKEVVVQGYARDLVKVAKALSMAAVAYASTTSRFGELKYMWYDRRVHSIAQLAIVILAAIGIFHSDASIIFARTLLLISKQLFDMIVVIYVARH